MERKWLKQEPKSKNCGQIAVAVIAGITIEEATKLVGKKGGTNTKMISAALRKLGYLCPIRCSKMKRPQLGIGQMKHPKRKSGWHWVVVDGDKIFDGINGNPDGTINWPEDWVITSYLPVRKEEL